MQETDLKQRIKLKRGENIHANCGGFALCQHKAELKTLFPRTPFPGQFHVRLTTGNICTRGVRRK